TVAASGHSY
nr:Chain C, Synthetic peptide THR-VAL-ALA-ALA-SER-GLY-HIS-SER-TYR [synthetic construct]6VB4_C Chain C, Synthetic peptide THR-VAL-ALA-ALA-SER-GLY-HIS-SER-TYR [synthetic construct]6VIU_C Chain C, THR-VAL-ALA-ALA-SER-GLY-HIS-SER-TYR [synthetic construct]